MKRQVRENNEYTVIARSEAKPVIARSEATKQSQKRYCFATAWLAMTHCACAFAMTVALAFIFSFLFVNFACAEVMTLKKPLIWALDKSSDYQLPEAATGGIYAQQEFIAARSPASPLTGKPAVKLILK